MLTIFYRFGLQRYEFLCKRPNKNAKICRFLHFLYNKAMFPPVIKINNPSVIAVIVIGGGEKYYNFLC